MQTQILILIAAILVPIIMSAPTNPASDPANASVNGPDAKAAIQHLTKFVGENLRKLSKRMDTINDGLSKAQKDLTKLTKKEEYCKDYVEQALALAKLFVGQGLTLRKYIPTDEYPCNQEPCYSPQVQATSDHFSSL